MVFGLGFAPVLCAGVALSAFFFYSIQPMAGF
jgi:hypothetical protein